MPQNLTGLRTDHGWVLRVIPAAYLLDRMPQHTFQHSQPVPDPTAGTGQIDHDRTAGDTGQSPRQHRGRHSE